MTCIFYHQCWSWLKPPLWFAARTWRAMDWEDYRWKVLMRRTGSWFQYLGIFTWTLKGRVDRSFFPYMRIYSAQHKHRPGQHTWTVGPAGGCFCSRSAGRVSRWWPLFFESFENWSSADLYFQRVAPQVAFGISGDFFNARRSSKIVLEELHRASEPWALWRYFIPENLVRLWRPTQLQFGTGSFTQLWGQKVQKMDGCVFPTWPSLVCHTVCGGGIPLKNPNRFMRPAVCFTSLTLTLLISSPLVQVQHLGCSHYHSCLLVHAAVDSNQRAQLFERRQYASDIFRLFSHSRSRTDLMSLHFKPISKWNAMKLAHFLKFFFMWPQGLRPFALIWIFADRVDRFIGCGKKKKGREPQNYFWGGEYLVAWMMGTEKDGEGKDHAICKTLRKIHAITAKTCQLHRGGPEPGFKPSTSHGRTHRPLCHFSHNKRLKKKKKKAAF